jgi:hypothetical protein
MQIDQLKRREFITLVGGSDRQLIRAHARYANSSFDVDQCSTRPALSDGTWEGPPPHRLTETL